jgi:hypothetical protein
VQGRELLVSVLAVPAEAAAAWVAPSWQADTSTKLVLCGCASVQHVDHCCSRCAVCGGLLLGAVLLQRIQGPAGEHAGAHWHAWHGTCALWCTSSSTCLMSIAVLYSAAAMAVASAVCRTPVGSQAESAPSQQMRRRNSARTLHSLQSSHVLI